MRVEIESQEFYDHADDTEAHMEAEVRELIDAAKQRPITEDEASVLLWHCGLLTRKTQ